MKTLAPLFLAAITFGCAHEAIEQPITPYHATVPAPSVSTDAPIALAQKNYANGLVSEAFAGLQSAYQENQDLKYLEYSAALVDQEIRWMKSTMQEKATELHDANYFLEAFDKDEKVKVNTVQATNFLLLPAVPMALIDGYSYSYQKAKNEKLGLQKIKAEYVYSVLRNIYSSYGSVEKCHVEDSAIAFATDFRSQSQLRSVAIANKTNPKPARYNLRVKNTVYIGHFHWPTSQSG